MNVNPPLALFNFISTSIDGNSSFNIKREKALLAGGMVRILRSMGRVINLQIVITHSFERIGVYPVSLDKCLSNCDKTVLNTIPKYSIHMPKMVVLLLNEGQLSEEQFDLLGIPPNKNKLNFSSCSIIYFFIIYISVMFYLSLPSLLLPFSLLFLCIHLDVCSFMLSL